ncbi:DUF4932 domain-containing protein [Dyadobacter sp. CY323]|uniref:DUF4932 domain-containing protein n=1 Tax=Dyadobacter sp. CY323 TaxID=2907302 RepID=UPI001F2CEE7F|nr:DUF4932 domain-containing protein [Dyadobacter sp. CY323]MCE6991905.1 DUF4932 domain-containing protein [Dyadobacter sp. CY323]
MYVRLLLFTALVWATFSFGNQVSADPDDRRFVVQINKNVELLGFVYFLGYEGVQSKTADYSVKTKARYAYGLDLYEQYKRHENSENLAVAVGFAQDIWLDYFINLLIQLEDFPNAKLNEKMESRYYLRFSPKRDEAEARKNASAFLEAMNRLYREVDFDTYLSQNRNKYENALMQVKGGLPDGSFIPAMEKFYQGRLDTYNLVPSLTIPPGMGFGVKYGSDQKTNAFHVFGSFAIPSFNDASNLDMGFNDKKHLLELSTHEFGHSFVNQVIDQLPAEWIAETQRLFDPVKDVMSNQGYVAWKACLYEHFVRAGEIVIAQSLGHAADARRLREHYEHDRKFIYLPLILPELEAYQSIQKSTYKQAVESAMKRLRENSRD